MSLVVKDERIEQKNARAIVERDEESGGKLERRRELHSKLVGAVQEEQESWTLQQYIRLSNKYFYQFIEAAPCSKYSPHPLPGYWWLLLWLVETCGPNDQEMEILR